MTVIIVMEKIKNIILDKTPEILKELGFGEVDSLDWNENSFVISLEKYPDYEFLGKNDDVDVQDRFLEDIKEIRKAFKELDEDQKEEVYENYSLDKDDESSSEEIFVENMSEAWWTNRWPTAHFYIDEEGNFEYEMMDGSYVPSYPMELIDIYEPSAYLYVMGEVFSDEYLDLIKKELQK